MMVVNLPQLRFTSVGLHPHAPVRCRVGSELHILRRLEAVAVMLLEVLEEMQDHNETTISRPNFRLSMQWNLDQISPKSAIRLNWIQLVSMQRLRRHLSLTIMHRRQVCYRQQRIPSSLELVLFRQREIPHPHPPRQLRLLHRLHRPKKTMMTTMTMATEVLKFHNGPGV